MWITKSNSDSDEMKKYFEDAKTYWTQLEPINNNVAKRVKDAGIKVVQNYCAMIEDKMLF